MTPEERATKLLESFGWDFGLIAGHAQAEAIAGAIREAEQARDERWQLAVGMPLERAEELAKGERIT